MAARPRAPAPAPAGGTKQSRVVLATLLVIGVVGVGAVLVAGRLLSTPSQSAEEIALPSPAAGETGGRRREALLRLPQTPQATATREATHQQTPLSPEAQSGLVEKTRPATEPTPTAMTIPETPSPAVQAPESVLPSNPFAEAAIESWPGSANGPHTAIVWPLAVHAANPNANGLPSTGVDGSRREAWLGQGGMMLVRPCEQYSSGCFGLEASLRATRLWRKTALAQTRGGDHLFPWLENSDKFGAWVAPVNPEYKAVHVAALQASGIAGLYAAMSASRPENLAGTEFDITPMVGEIGSAVIHPEGRLLVQGRDGKLSKGLITLRCSLNDAKAGGLSPSNTNEVAESVVVTSQHMCNGPAHFLMECFIRLFLAASAANRLGAKIHVADGSPMTKAFLAAAGVPESRVVTGWVRSRRVIVPEGTDCGNPPTSSLQLMRRWAQAVAGKCPEDQQAEKSGERGRWVPFARQLDLLLASTDAATSTVGAPSPQDATRFCPYSGLDLGGAVAALGVEGGLAAYTEAVAAGGADKSAVAKLASCVVAHGGGAVVPDVSVDSGVATGVATVRRVRVLIVRRKSSRSIGNEQSLLEALRAAAEAVSTVSVFEPKSPADDMAAFANADVIVAPHGAGLANIVACPPWAHVVELLARPTNIMYGTISVRLAMKWHAFLPSAKGGGDAPHAGAAMQADVAAVLSRVKLAAAEIAALAREADGLGCDLVSRR